MMLIRLAAIAILVSGTFPVIASDLVDTPSPALAIHGFGTLGAVYHDEPGIQFRRDISQGRGAKKGQLSFEPDSILGLQATALLRPDVEASLQVISHLTAENNYRPEVAWGFIKYTGDHNLTLRAGRLGADFYMEGDSGEIGYSNPLVRPPVSLVPHGFDGIDADWRQPLGAGILRIKGVAGTLRGKSIAPAGGDPYDYSGSTTWGGFLEYARGNWTLRYAHGRVRFASDAAGAAYEELAAGLRLFAPNGQAIVDRLSLKGKHGSYRIAALTYDRGPMQLQASYDHLGPENWPVQREFIASAGYRIGSVMPYAGFVRQRSEPSVIPTGIPNGVSAATDMLNAGAALAQSAAGSVDQTNFILGMRYDFAVQKAFKIQAERVRYRYPATALDSALAAQIDGNARRRAFTVISMTLDFVF